MSPFVHPALFWGGIGLVSIPIIIHLITRRRFRRLEWAAMEFLLEAMRRNRRRIRIEQLILLLLRVSLVALAALAVARPHLPAEGLGWLSSPFRSEEKVFLIDDSMSMGHTELGRSSMARAAEPVIAAAERIAAAGSRDPLTIIRASRYQVPLASAVTVDSERLEGLRQELASLPPTAARMDLAAALEDLAGTAREERGRAISILTDLCARDWTDGRGGPLETLDRALRRVTGADSDTQQPGGTRVLILDVGPSRRDNLAVTAFTLETASPVAGIPAELSVEVTNFGRETARGAGIRLRSPENLTPGPRIAEIAPGETARLKVIHSFPRPGSTWIAAEIDGSADGLPADDRRALAVEVVEAVEVLVVDGEPSGVLGEGETDFLAQALRPEGDFSSGFAPSVVVEANLPREGLERFGAIIIANLASIPGDFIAPLSRYVREGGALIIFPGDQVDPNVYERALGAGTPEQPGADLLPGSIGEQAGDPERPVHLAPLFDHPAFRLLAGGGDELLRLVDVGRFQKLAPRPDARVAARLTDPESSPFLLERQVGLGRVALFAVPADLEWTTWPRSPTFLPVILELVGSMARQRGAGWTRLAGAPFSMPLDLARHQREARLRRPDYPASPEERLLAAAPAGEEAGPDPAAAGAGFRFAIEDTRQAGVYTLILRTVAGEEESRHLAINPEPVESDLAPLDPARLAALYPGIDLTVIRDPGALLDPGMGRFEIADALLAIFIAVLMVEGLLAWWFAHHRRPAAESPAGAGGAPPAAYGARPAAAMALRAAGGAAGRPGAGQ